MSSGTHGSSRPAANFSELERNLGISLPPSFRDAWNSALQSGGLVLGETPASVLRLSYADEMTPIEYLPISRFEDFSTAGIYFPLGNPGAAAVAVQDFGMKWVDLITSEFDDYLSNNKKFIKNTTRKLASRDSTVLAIRQDAVPGLRGSWDESDVFRSFWFEAAGFRYEAKSVFSAIVSSYGTSTGAFADVRKVFPKASDYGIPANWQRLVDALVASRNYRGALRVADNWRALLLVGMKEFKETWPPYWEDAKHLWDVVKQEIKIAQKLPRPFEVALLKAIMSRRRASAGSSE